jgi:hypothetical protein
MGGRHSCSFNAANGLRCWGWGDKYQLGTGTMSNQSTPTATLLTCP